MQIPGRKIDNNSVYRATGDARFRIDVLREKVKSFDEDAKRADRLAMRQCKRCHYIDNSRIGGAAMTRSECGICKTETQFGNTCVDVICKECSKKFGLCVHCGGDIEMKYRKEKREFA